MKKVNSIESGDFQYQDIDVTPLSSQNSSTLRKVANIVLPLGLVVFTAMFALSLSNIRTIVSDSSKSVIGLAEESAIKPNIVFILADDLGYMSLGKEEYDLNFATPTLTKLAKSGVVLSNYYTQEVCTPARASLLTGRLPISVGMQFGTLEPTHKWGLNLGETLLPEVLREQGNYKNYALGKWNLGHYSPKYLPTARGFDHFIGYMDGQNYYWSKLNPDNEAYFDFMYSDNECYEFYDGADRHTYSTTFYTEKAIKVMKNHNYDNTPLFLYYASQAVHDPFIDYETYLAGIPSSYIGEERYNQIITSIIGAKRQQYVMSLMLLDDAVNEMITTLEELKQLDNTYIIFTSDNGGCYSAGGKSGPLRGTKGTLFEGGTKVDAFIYSPLLPTSVQGTVYTGLFHVSDWFPTILSLAGINNYHSVPGKAIDGYNHAKHILTPSSSQTTPYPREYLLYNMYTNVKDKHLDIYTNAPVAIRSKQYKLMHSYQSSSTSNWYQYDTLVEHDDNYNMTSTCSQSDAMMGDYTYYLFDLTMDPTESNNLFNVEKFNKVKEELYEQIAIMKAKAITEEIPSSANAKNNGEVQLYWNNHNKFIQPWDIPQQVVSSEYPRLCSKLDTVFSPIYKEKIEE